MEQQILAALARKNYQPLKPKALAKKLGVSGGKYDEFRKILRDLAKQGRVQFGKSHTVRAAPAADTITGVYRRLSSGRGFVVPHTVDGAPAGPGISIPPDNGGDAATGDDVVVRIIRTAQGDSP